MELDLDKMEEQWPMGWAKTQPTPDQDVTATNAFIDNTAGLFGGPEAPPPAKLDFAPAQDLLNRDSERIKAITAAPDPLAERETRRANLDKAIQGYADLALKAPKPEDASWATRRAERIAQVGEQIGHLPPGGAEQRIQQLYDRVDHGHAERVLKQSPADLQTLLADGAMFSGLAPENRATLLARAAARIQGASEHEPFNARVAGAGQALDQVTARTGAAMTLADGVARGQVTLADLHDARAAGRIDDTQARELRRAVETRVDDQERRARVVQTGADAFWKGRALDRDNPDHVAGANGYFQRLDELRKAGTIDRPAWRQALVRMGTSYGFVPSDLARRIDGAMRLDNPENRVGAATIIGAWREQAPRLLADLPAPSVAQGLAVKAMVDAGYPTEQAAQRATALFTDQPQDPHAAHDRRNLATTLLRTADDIERGLGDNKGNRTADPSPRTNDVPRVLREFANHLKGPQGPMLVNPVHRPRPGDGPMLVNPVDRSPAPINDPQPYLRLLSDTQPGAGQDPQAPNANGDDPARLGGPNPVQVQQRRREAQEAIRRIADDPANADQLPTTPNGLVQFGPYALRRDVVPFVTRILAARTEEERNALMHEIMGSGLPDRLQRGLFDLMGAARGEGNLLDPNDPESANRLGRRLSALNSGNLDDPYNEAPALIGGMGGRRGAPTQPAPRVSPSGRPAANAPSQEQAPGLPPPTQSQPPAVQGPPQPPGLPSQGTPPAQPTSPQQTLPQPTAPTAARPAVVEPAPNQAPNTNPIPAAPPPSGAPSSPPTAPEISNPQTGRQTLRLSPENEARALARIERVQREQEENSRPQPTWRVPGVPDDMQPRARALLVPNQSPREVVLSREDHEFLVTYIDRNHPPRSATQAQRDALIPRATGFEFGIPEVDTPLRMMPERVLHAWYRHHPRYWDGSSGERAQSFFPENFSFSDMRRVINEAISQNNEFFQQQMNSPYSTLEFTVNRVRYTIGVEYGEITRFSPIREPRTPWRSQ